MKVLILGLTNKTGLAVARNLSKFGCLVDAIYINDVAARHSKYVNNSYFFGDPELDVNAFTDNLLKHLSDNEYDGLIPIHDAALEICRYKKQEISAKVKIAGLNEDSSYKYSINKHEMLTIGEKNGLTIPKSILIETLTSFQEIERTNFNFPIVAKPVSSAAIRNNKLYAYSVKICKNYEELTNFIRENVNSVNILIQEFVKGYGIGYNFISKNGKIQNEYIHRRINENNGVSSLRESLTTENYNLKTKVTKIVEEMNWNGVGMIEFMIKPDDSAVLMEFNGRFFGSVELSAKSGINLPVLFLKQFILDQEIPENLPLKRSSVRYIHDEVILYSSYLFQGKSKLFYRWFFELIGSLFKSRHYFETTVLNDYRFSFAFYRYNLKRIFSKLKRKKKVKQIQIKSLSKTDLTGIKKITYVCFGNICRSPFAHFISQIYTDQFQFDSIGFVNKENRLSPTNAVLAAKNFSVNLDLHLSKSISNFDNYETDLFIVMDKSNYYELQQRGIPDSKIRFLANQEITDPYGKSLDQFQDIYLKIEKEIIRIFNTK